MEQCVYLLIMFSSSFFISYFFTGWLEKKEEENLRKAIKECKEALEILNKTARKL